MSVDLISSLIWSLLFGIYLGFGIWNLFGICYLEFIWDLGFEFWNFLGSCLPTGIQGSWFLISLLNAGTCD